MTNEHFQSIKDRTRRGVVALHGYPVIEALADVRALIEHIEQREAGLVMPAASDEAARVLTDFALSEPMNGGVKREIGILLSERRALHAIVMSVAQQSALFRSKLSASEDQLKRLRGELEGMEEKIEKLENSR